MFCPPSGAKYPFFQAPAHGVHILYHIFLLPMLLILLEGFRLIAQSLLLKMPVNAAQYRVTVGIFNNRKLIISLGSELPPCSKLSNLKNLSQLTFHYCFTSFSAFLFSKDIVSKNSTKFYISIFLLFNICLRVLVQLCGRLIIVSADVEVNSEPKNNLNKVCQFITRTSTALLPMTISHYFFRRHIIYFTNLILFVSKKHTLILVFPLLMMSW